MGEKICILCQGHCYDTAQHILFECESGHKDKVKLWKCVTEVCPQRLAMELSNMSIRCKTKFVVNAMNCNYTDEWYDVLVYMTMCNYIHTIYMYYYKVCTCCP